MKILLLILFTLTSVAFSTAAPPDRAAEDLDVREATYRYQFEKNASGQQQRAGAYYLAFPVKDGKMTDPPTGFIKRFADSKPPVKRASECDASADEGVVDKETGKTGLIFATGDIKWISDTEAEIAGGYYEGGLSASDNTYYLKKVDGRWKVINDVMHGIS